MLQNQSVRRIDVDNGRCLTVYDNVIDFEFRNRVYNFAQNSLFRIGWSDSSVIENKHHRSLHSSYSEDDMARLGLLERLKQTCVADEMSGHVLSSCVMNLSTPADANFLHAHPEDKIILYYVNLEWRDGWHGETLFFDESGKEVVYTSPYTPGRIIAFDGRIPHTIRPQSYLSPFYRFTLAMVYKKC